MSKTLTKLVNRAIYNHEKKVVEKYQLFRVVPKKNNTEGFVTSARSKTHAIKKAAHILQMKETALTATRL